MTYYLEIMNKNWCRAECLNSLILHGDSIQKWIQMCMYVQNKSDQYRKSTRLILINKNQEEVLYKASYINKK